MPAGRPKKPSSLKKVQGTDQPCRRNDKEPQPSNDAPKPPRWLNSKAKWAFTELSKELEDMQVLTHADRKALELLCDAYAEYREARQTIIKEGMTYVATTKSGTMIQKRPEVSIASDAWRRVQRMLSEFGLTPSSRAGVQTIKKDDEEDPFEQFQQMQQQEKLKRVK